MAAFHKLPFPVDALPVAVGEAYDNLTNELEEWMQVDTPFGAEILLIHFDECLAKCASAAERLRFLCGLTTLGGREPGMLFAAGRLSAPGFEEVYSTWLAVRLTEAVCVFVGNSLLRSGRVTLDSTWESVSQHQRIFRVRRGDAGLLLQFLFGVLIPHAHTNKYQQPQRFNDLANQVTQENPYAYAKAEPAAAQKTPAPTALPQTLDTLCRPPFSPTDLRALLVDLNVLDEETGHWHLGELKGKAASPLSAFPAAYRALHEARLVLPTDAPVYRKLFCAAYRVQFSDRVANFKEGSPSASAAFHDYLNRARYWIKIWKTKQ